MPYANKDTLARAMAATPTGGAVGYERIDTLEGFNKAWVKHRSEFASTDGVLHPRLKAWAERLRGGGELFPWTAYQPPAAVIGEAFCAKCPGIRRMILHLLSPLWFPAENEGEYHDRTGFLPLVGKVVCVQCQCESILVRSMGPAGKQLVILSSAAGGISTPLTPEAVKYYLDQAHRSQSVGAFSAAVGAYRSAIEHLLHDQGFTDGMLYKKLLDLEAKVKAGNAPVWAQQLSVAKAMKSLQRLGNGAMHTNGGDISKQAVLDAELLTVVQSTTAWLLEAVYEGPGRIAAALATMDAAADVMKP